MKPLIYKAFQHLFLSILRKSLIFLDFCQIYYFFKKSTSQTLINRAFQKAIKPNFYGHNYPKDVSFFTLKRYIFCFQKWNFTNLLYVCLFIISLFISSPKPNKQFVTISMSFSWLIFLNTSKLSDIFNHLFLFWEEQIYFLLWC